MKNYMKNYCFNELLDTKKSLYVVSQFKFQKFIEKNSLNWSQRLSGNTV